MPLIGFTGSDVFDLSIINRRILVFWIIGPCAIGTRGVIARAVTVVVADLVIVGIVAPGLEAIVVCRLGGARRGKVRDPGFDL